MTLAGVASAQAPRTSEDFDGTCLWPELEVPQGWTQDGRFFVATQKAECLDSDGFAGRVFERAELGLVLDVQTGLRQRFRISHQKTVFPPDGFTAEEQEDIPDLWNQLSDWFPPDEWEKWIKAHPLVPARPLGTRELGSVRLTVTPGARGAQFRQQWGDDGVLRIHADADETVTIIVIVQVQQQDATLAESSLETIGQDLEVRFWGSPNGDAVVAAIDTPGWHPDISQVHFPTARDFLSLRSAPLKIELASPPDESAEQRESVVKFLAARGYPVSHERAAQSTREQTTIYFASGFDAAARAIASTFTPSAAIAPLSWKSPYEIVIAIGTRRTDR